MSTLSGQKDAMEALPSGLFVPYSVAERAPAAGAGTSTAVGRPAYAPGHTDATLTETIDPQLLWQFYSNVPALKRAVEILAGFVGVPQFADQSLQDWAEMVPVGYIGHGLQTWITDHLTQALIFGYAVGEGEVAQSRQGVSRLWSYTSPGCRFRARPDGSLQIIQQQPGKGEVPLRMLSTVSTTYNPIGTDPRGQSLFLAIPTVAQTWLDILHAYRGTWRRNGIPTWHINWEPPPTLVDPKGEIAARVIGGLQTSFNQSMKSQVTRGVAYDFYTAGKVRVEPLGVNSVVIDITPSKRAIVEEIVVATGIPPWMLGYTWSTTERLSQQQADTLVAVVGCIRRCATGAIQQLALLQRRLGGKAGMVEMTWPDVNLQDELVQAQAERARAEAMERRQKVWRAMWVDGVTDQTGYGSGTLGEEVTPVRPMEEPPSLAPPGAPEEEERPNRDDEESEERRAAGDYRGFFRACCPEHVAGKASADDPVRLWPDERPQWVELRREVERAWGATTESFGRLRADWFEVMALDRPEKAAKQEATPEQLAALDAAIEQFLREFAGVDRTQLGFSGADTEDGILQQLEVLAYSAGQQRAVALMDASAGPLTAATRQRLLNDAFERLTEGSRFRFESRLGEIRQGMVDGLARGESPAVVARRLERDLDGYERTRLRTIVRTEAAIAAEGAILDVGEADGIERWEVVGDPGTDQLCVSAQQGGPYTTAQMRGFLPRHPCCYCSAAPDPEELERRAAQAGGSGNTGPALTEEQLRQLGRLEEDARNRWPGVTFDFQGMHPDAAAETVRALRRMERAQPAAFARLEYIGTYENPDGPPPGELATADEYALTSGDGRKIHLNPLWFGNPVEMRRLLQRTTRRRQNPPGADTIESVVIHEFGHVVETWLKEDGQGKALLPYVDGADGLGYISDTFDLLFDRHETDGQQVSLYAGFSRGETWAEGFVSHFVTPAGQQRDWVRLQRAFLDAAGDGSQWVDNPQRVQDLSGAERTRARRQLTRLRRRLRLD